MINNGSQLREKGISKAIDNANNTHGKWSDKAYKFLLGYIKSQHEFMTEDLRLASEKEIAQDYQLVLDAANRAGFNGSKILVIGTPGSGKTYALKTLVNHSGEKTIKKNETKGVTA